MKLRFKNLLIGGKIATLPMLMKTAYAQYSPTFNDLLNTNITQLQVPVAQSIQLKALGSSYGAVNGSALICSANLPNSPSTMSLVITGLQPNDMLFIATSTSLGGNQSLNPKILLGTQNLLTPFVTQINGPSNSTINVTVPLDLVKLRSQGYPILNGGTFYLQSIAFPNGAVSSSGFNWAQARISELDVISIGPCSTTYGSPY
jgi:hypothetical protein